MFDFIREHQLNFMLVLSGVTGIIAFFVFVTTTLSKRRKFALTALELGAMFLLVFDRFAYIYRGDMSLTGYIMVRLSNFMVFILTPFINGAFNLYLIDLITTEGKEKRPPKPLIVCNYLAYTAIILVVISQFTGFYYTFDSNNRYQREPGFLLFFAIPMIIMTIEVYVIIKHGKNISSGIYTSLLLFSLTVIIAPIIQLFTYGISVINMTCVGMAVLIYLFALVDTNKTAERVHRQELEYFKAEQEHMTRLFQQTSATFVGVLDAKNKFIDGHSHRVADYSRMIAEKAGMSKEKCDDVYFAALLHDAGKMGIPDAILTKNERLTVEENELYMKHTEIGRDILSQITDYSHLSDGAYYHHERYDGGGYPEGLSGDDIPEVARIIAIADFYDILTSQRSYRDRLPQKRVREELTKEAGARFDPFFSRMMIELIDADKDYTMKGSGDEVEISWKKPLHIGDYRALVSSGIMFSHKVKNVEFSYIPDKVSEGKFSLPALILFDSLDGLVHSSGRGIRDYSYTEYGEIFLDGHIICTAARDMRLNVEDAEEKAARTGINNDKVKYSLTMARYSDHVIVRINGGGREMEVIAALPDNSRYAYLCITGENCVIEDIDVRDTETIIDENYIPRIAEEITYTDRMESDLPNIQIDANRSATTPGVLLKDKLRLAFHTMSLPAAHFVWHCPYIVIYSSDDGEVFGSNYAEYALIRLDGELEGPFTMSENKFYSSKNDSFENWDKWLEINKKGMECYVTFRRYGKKILTETENGGIYIQNMTTMNTLRENVYVAITGDICAITDIRVFDS